MSMSTIKISSPSFDEIIIDHNPKTSIDIASDAGIQR